MYVLLEAKDVLDGEVKALMHAFPQKEVLDEVQIKLGANRARRGKSSSPSCRTSRSVPP